MSDISTGVKEMLWLWLCGKADKNMFGTIEGREAVLIAYFVIDFNIKTVLNVTYCMC